MKPLFTYILLADIINSEFNNIANFVYEKYAKHKKKNYVINDKLYIDFSTKVIKKTFESCINNYLLNLSHTNCGIRGIILVKSCYDYKLTEYGKKLYYINENDFNITIENLIKNVTEQSKSIKNLLKYVYIIDIDKKCQLSELEIETVLNERYKIIQQINIKSDKIITGGDLMYLTEYKIQMLESELHKKGVI